MDMNILLKSIIVLPIVDFIYISLITSQFKKQIFDIQKSEMKFRWIPAIICYIALIGVLNYFILNTSDTLNKKVLNAFILGLCVYAVYETTNYALIDNWSLNIVIIDTLWGGILFALTTYLVNIKF